MVGKYNLLEKDIYKRMFNNKENKPLQLENKENTGQEFIMAEKESLQKSRDVILAKLKYKFTVIIEIKMIYLINFVT